jgi:hypothetical protein
MQLGRLFPSENLIGQMLAADRQRLKQITTGISATQTMNRLLEAEQERTERLLEAFHPCRGLFEVLRNQTSGLEQLAAASSRNLASLDIGLGIDVISSSETVGEFTPPADLQGQLRIHAVPLLPSRPRGRDEADMRCAPHTSLLQVPEMTSDPLDAGSETDNSLMLLEELMRFQRSDQIPRDAREGISALTNWWKMHWLRITPDQSREFNRTVQRFIEGQLDLVAAPDVNRKRDGGPTIPGSCESSRQQPDVDLDPRIYRSLKLSKILIYNDSTIRRQAEAAWRKAGGVGPCLLKKGSDWYVVAAPEDGGGKKTGWKFQKRQSSNPK